MQPLRQKSQRGQVSRVQSFPAPTKGWYVGANMAEAPPGTAYALVNAFCGLDYIRARGGCAAWATGMPSGVVATLMRWTNGVSEKMFAVRGGSIYDVSSTGAVGAAAVTGMTSDYLEAIQFTGTGGTFLIGVNGYDPAQIWNGSAWVTTPAITGLTGNPLAQIWTYKSRIYGVERDSLHAWYLGLDSIGGAATVFPLSSIFKLGGSLVCGGTWAVDSSSGIYELCVFISSEGEVAVYNGPYPGDPSWTLVGTYKVSRPLGRRCLMQAGGDLAIMTEDGIVPMSKVETLDQIALQNEAVTVPIAPAWRDAVLARQGVVGWQIVMWPLQSMGIVNLPKKDGGDRTQFIANARTGAWSKYVGWDANCFCIFQNNLFFGSSDGRVMQAEIGGYDDGGNYSVVIFPSFSDCGAPGVRKNLRLVRPMAQSNFYGGVQVSVNLDFNTAIPIAPSAVSTVPPGTALWGVAKWGIGLWPNGVISQATWRSAPGYGYVLAPIVQVTLSQAVTPDFRLTTIDVLFEAGNSVG